MNAVASALFRPGLARGRTRPARRHLIDLTVGEVAGILIGAVVLVFLASGVDVAYLRPAVGFLAALGVPAYIIATTTDWRGMPWRERVVLSVSGAIISLTVVGLALDLAGPVVGIPRPLDRMPAVTVTGLVWALVWWRRRDRHVPLRAHLSGVAIGRLDVAAVTGAALVVVAAVAGANRLNNNRGSGVAVATQIALVLLVAFVLIGHKRLASAAVAVVLYGVGLALLLQTSLRGWFISGHDIEHEYLVFTKTATLGHWSFSNIHDAYNACLSVTVLPTMLLRFMGMDPAYVFKVGFQLLFAFAPVIVYCLARRLLSGGLAVVAAVFFVAFPTFFTDMPFLNRQEMAFLLCGCAFLLLVATEMPLHRRRRWTMVLVTATVVAHYSTAYLFLAVLVGAKVLEAVTRRRAASGVRERPRSPISVAIIAVGLALSLAWGAGPAQSDRHLLGTLGRVGSDLIGNTTSTKASSTSYSLIGSSSANDLQELKQYIASTLPAGGAARAEAEKLIKQYPTHPVNTPNLKATALGRAFDHLGINVGALNSDLRSLAARLFQLLVAAGLVAAVVIGWYRRRRQRSLGPDSFDLYGRHPDLYLVAVASFVVVGAQAVLPQLSVDYGLLRAFQQGLLVLAPFMVIGCAWIVGVLGRRAAAVGSAGLAVILLSSLSGLLPQILGGYPPQMTLNNSGDYYNWYYTSAQEVDAAGWLAAHAPANGSYAAAWLSSQALANYTSLYYAGDIYPTLIMHRGSFVFLGYATTVLGQTTASPGGDFITYSYPTAYLGSTRDLIYASPDERIYH